jgi:hypothetical protein
VYQYIYSLNEVTMIEKRIHHLTSSKQVVNRHFVVRLDAREQDVYDVKTG